MKKKDFSALDESIVRALVSRPYPLLEILDLADVRDNALRVLRLRAGASRSGSADTTVRDRLQILRRDGKITYDKATRRWTSVSKT